MSGELIAVLKERLHKNYEEFLTQLQGKSAPELIAMVAEITAAKQCLSLIHISEPTRP